MYLNFVSTRSLVLAGDTVIYWHNYVSRYVVKTDLCTIHSHKRKSMYIVLT